MIQLYTDSTSSDCRVIPVHSVRRTRTVRGISIPVGHSVPKVLVQYVRTGTVHVQVPVLVLGRAYCTCTGTSTGTCTSTCTGLGLLYV